MGSIAVVVGDVLADEAEQMPLHKQIEAIAQRAA
jgi:hypothetical protein